MKVKKSNNNENVKQTENIKIEPERSKCVIKVVN